MYQPCIFQGEDVEPTGGDDFDRLLRRLAAKDVRFRRLHGRPEQQTRSSDRIEDLKGLTQYHETIFQYLQVFFRYYL